MSFPDTVFLHDRIKEISHDTGAGNLSLDSAATGFGAFSTVYSNGDAIFYAVTDGTAYEVGSGTYFNDGGSNQSISRFAFNSSNSNNNVPFNPGIKEVFVSYPGKFALFSAGGMNGFTQPDVSGMAFFGSQQTVDYSSNVIFDKNNSRIGIAQSAPEYSIDIGGTPGNSLMRSSGVIVAESGIIFSGVSPAHTSAYSGGIQLEPFMRNELDPTTGSNAIFSLSGLVEQRLLLDKQIKGSIFAGPASGCIGAGCSPDYPTFRYLAWQDIPDLSHLYTVQFVDAVANVPYQGDVTFYKESGVLDHDHFFNWDATNNRLGINRTDPDFTLDVDGDASISGSLYVQSDANIEGHLNVSGNVVISGNLDVQGGLTYIDSHTVTIWDKQLELGSMSGTALYADALLDDAGIAIKSTNYDKKWTWRDSNDSWRTDEGIGASGLLEVSGHATFGNDLLVNNNATVSGMFNASGNSIFDGNISAQKKLFVAGDTTVSGNLNVSGVSIFNDDTFFTTNAPVVMSGTLGVSGDVLFDTLLEFTDGHIRIGENAGVGYEDAEENIHIGEAAGANASGERTIAIGHNAGLRSSGNYSLFVGNGAGVRSVGTLRQAGFGDQCATNTSGCEYSLIGGYSAGYAATGCTHSVFWGPYAGMHAGGPGAVGSGLAESVAIGSGAGEWAKGKHNFLLGGRAGYYASGTNNIYIGILAGAHVSGVSNLEISTIGASLLPSNTLTSNKLNINEMIVGDKSTKRLAIGNVDATNLSPNATLEIKPKNATDLAILSSGDIHIPSGTIEFDVENSPTPTDCIVTVSGSNTTNIVVNSSGLLTVPIFNGTAASLASTLPPATWTSGAIVFINDPSNPKALAVNNGDTWYSGILS